MVDATVWCDRQHRSNAAKCNDVWLGRYSCCFAIDHNDPYPHEFGHCDDGFDDIVLDNTKP